MFQKYHLIDDLPVQENLDLPLSYRGMKSKDCSGVLRDAAASAWWVESICIRVSFQAGSSSW
jgi:ABC-type lipoprotein export system ATPase subunit